MRYIDTWLNGLGLDYIIPKLRDHGITTPKQLATLSLREIYEVGMFTLYDTCKGLFVEFYSCTKSFTVLVGVEDSDDRKKLYFLIQRLQTVSLLCLRSFHWQVYHCSSMQILQYKPTTEDQEGTSSYLSAAEKSSNLGIFTYMRHYPEFLIPM